MGIRSAMAPARPLDLSKQNHYYHPHHQSHQQLPHHHQNHGFHIPMLLILICLISIVLLFAVFLIILLLRRHHPRENNESSNSSSSSNNNKIHHKLRRYSSSENTINSDASPDVKDRCLYGGSFGRIPSSKFRGVQVFTYKEIDIATNAFSEANVIGNGRFGVVYRGVLSDGTVAAIKMLNREGKHGEREFRIEVDLLNRLHSSYLVDLLGYCADQHHRILIFEFMPNGSLQQHLHSPHKQHQILNWGTRLRIALDCARALEFLHEYAVPPIIHRDLKSSNVVLDQNFRAKVSDLGLAKIASEKINSQISIPMAGPTGYLAPEYTSTGKLTTKSDVYSYGVVLLELITGRVPIDTNRPPGEHILVSWALPRLTNREKVEGMVDPALQGKFSKKELIQVAAIAAVCVQQEAEYRPLMTDVVQSLIPLVKNLSSTCPSNSFRFNNRTVSPRS